MPMRGRILNQCTVNVFGFFFRLPEVAEYAVTALEHLIIEPLKQSRAFRENAQRFSRTSA